MFLLSLFLPLFRSTILFVGNRQRDLFHLFLENINLVEEHNKGRVSEKDVVDHFAEEMLALLHPVGRLVLVQRLVVVAQGDDEQH